jgi:putative peptidoglycan binding protein
MSYFMMSQAMNGFGGCCGFGAVASGGGGIASTFNADAIWNDCLQGAPPTSNNAAGKRCGQAVQAALNQLGYGPLTVDGQIGSGTMAAIKRFSQDNGFGSANWPTHAMLLKMEELLKAGQTPGPNAPVETHKVGDEYVPGAGPGGGAAKAGLSTGMMIGIGALALLAVGGLAIMAKKKKAGAPSQSSASTAMVKAHV